ncbi:MAG: FliH/SctL family protein [Gemmobacter sp.]
MKMMPPALAAASEAVVPVRPVALGDLPGLMQSARATGFRQAQAPAEGAFRAFDPLAVALRLDPLPTAEVPLPQAPAPSAAPLPEPAPSVAPPPRDPAAELRRAQAAAHAEGLAEGIAQGRQEARTELQAKLEETLHLLAIAHDRLVRPTASDTAALSQTVLDAVRRLSAERAGRLIDEDPLPFLARIEQMAERIAQGSAGVELRLNPADLALVAPHLAQSAQLAGAKVAAEAGLVRGDVDLRLPGLHLADLLFPEAGGRT